MNVPLPRLPTLTLPDAPSWPEPVAPDLAATLDDTTAHLAASRWCAADGFRLARDCIVCPCGWMSPLCRVLPSEASS